MAYNNPYYKPSTEVFADNVRQMTYAPDGNAMFDSYRRQKADERAQQKPAATRSADPYAEEEATAKQNYYKSLQEALDYNRREQERNSVDPKRQRWSAIASAATDAISGIAGMIGVANGAVHPATLKSASEVTNEEYEKRRKRYVDALKSGNELKANYWKQMLADVQQRRKNAYEANQNDLRLKILQSNLERSEANAATARNNTDYSSHRAAIAGINEQDQHALNQSRIDRNNYRTPQSSRSSGTSSKKTQSGIGRPTRTY